MSHSLHTLLIYFTGKKKKKKKNPRFYIFVAGDVKSISISSCGSAEDSGGFQRPAPPPLTPIHLGSQPLPDLCHGAI